MDRGRPPIGDRKAVSDREIHDVGEWKDNRRRRGQAGNTEIGPTVSVSHDKVREHDHGRRKQDAKRAEPPVKVHVAGPNELGLQGEQDVPRQEDGPVHMEQ